MRAWRALQTLQLQLNGLLSRDLSARSELGYQDYVVLVALTDIPGGRARLFELGELLLWEKSRLSRHVSRMMARGLVRKAACSGDRRGTVVEVTPTGRRLMAEAAPGHVAAVRELFIDHLSRAELAALAQICERVLAHLATPACSER